MTLAADHRRRVPSESDAILNALPNPVLLIASDGRIVDANIAAESFFEISAQFLQRQSLKELVPFGSPLLALIDQRQQRAAERHQFLQRLPLQELGRNLEEGFGGDVGVDDAAVGRNKQHRVGQRVEDGLAIGGHALAMFCG